MGLTACRARLMLAAKRAGADFSSTLTLGRQNCRIFPGEMGALRREFGLGDDGPEGLRYGGYADALFRAHLGAKRLAFMDYSDYQGADLVHDLNIPVGPELEGRWDVVVDGGTLEHVFNFPVAIANCMRLLRVGGSLFIFSMANNHCGHGFYQFSPELFFRIFQAENGFAIRDVILVRHPFPGAELSPRQECFRVEDPARLGRRTSLVTRSPLGIMVHAVKTGNAIPFRTFPQQSDYVPEWEGGGGGAPAKASAAGVLRRIWAGLPLPIRLRAEGYRQLWRYSLTRDGGAYKPWP